MESSKIITIINESDGLPYGATFTVEYKTREQFTKEALSKYSIEELLIYCASKTGQERLVTTNIPFRNCLEKVHEYTRAALIEMRKYELDNILDGELESN